MRLSGMILTLIAGVAAGGCASRPIDPTQYQSASCSELNVAVGETSKEISAAAISRGRTSQVNIPGWVPGGQKALGAIKERETAGIERLQEQGAAIDAERNRRC